MERTWGEGAGLRTRLAPRSIRGKLLLGFGLIQLALSAVVLVVVPPQFRRDLRQAAAERTAATAAVASSVLASALASADSAGIAEALSLLLADPVVGYATVVDRTGAVVARSGSPGSPPRPVAATADDRPPGGLLHVAHVVEAGGAPLGTLHLSLTTESLDAVVARSRGGIVLSQGLILLLVLAGTLPVSRLVTRPLTRIARTAERIAAGETDHRLPASGDRELDVVVGSFNRMVARLEAARRDVEATNRTLEQRVSERAAELERQVEERSRVEVALRRSEERYRKTFEASLAVQLLTDAETGGIVGANPAACAFYGYTREQLEGMHIGDLNVLGKDGVMTPLRRAAAGAQTRFIFRHRLASGEVRRVEVYPSRTEMEGRPVMHSIVHDVTQREQGHAALRESEARFRSLVEQSLVGIYVIRGDRFTYVNPRFAEIFGYTPVAVLRLGEARRLVHPEDWPTVREALEKRLSGEVEALQYSFRGMRRDGSVVQVTVHGSRTMMDGSPVIVGALVDETERHEAEEAQRTLEEQLRHAQKMEAVGRLSGGVAHDFNNLITAIHGCTALAMDDPGLGEAGRANLQEVLDASERAAGLTRQLLAFSRKQVLRAESLNLNHVAAGLESLLLRLVGENVELSLELAPGLPPVRADRGQLEQVLMNLAVNARDAMPEGGRLRIRTSTLELPLPPEQGPQPVELAELEAGTYVRVSVADTGTGIDPDILPRIFEPFFTTKEQGKGTGLGLATAFGIVKQSAGHMHADSTPGVGATFHVLLPAASGDSPEGRAASARVAGRAAVRETASEAGSDPAAVSTAAHAVLVVEDEAPLRRLVKRVLERRGYTVMVAADGREALDLAAATNGSLTLVVTDILMPGMDGIELAARLRERRPALPVLFTSGNAEHASDRAEGVARHGTFLEKPFTPSQLVAVVDSLVGQAATSA